MKGYRMAILIDESIAPSYDEGYIMRTRAQMRAVGRSLSNYDILYEHTIND